jgi:GTP-binding protein
MRENVKIDSAEFVLSAMRREQFRRDGRPEIAFVGRSNVGKSSLLNKLVRKKGLARTGSTPGRTRAVNYFLINDRFYFVDLPGYGFAKASRSERQKWAELMNDYFRAQHAAGRPEDAPEKLLVQLVDSKVGATALDVEAQDYFQHLGLAQLLVATKIDKVPRSRRHRALKAIRERLEIPDHVSLVPFSAQSGEGVQELWKGVRNYLTGEPVHSGEQDQI